MVFPEAMLNELPIVAPNMAGYPEVVDEGVTGLLFEPGNADDLADKIRYLWDNPSVCKQMGQAGHQKALSQYSSEKYYLNLMSVYISIGQ